MHIRELAVPRSELPPSAAYVSIDPFLVGTAESLALDAAFRLGVIDELFTSLPVAGGSPRIAWLWQLLAAGGVVTADRGGVRMTPAFQQALEFRPLLEGKLHFAKLLARDLSFDMARVLRLGAFDPGYVPEYLRFYSFGDTESLNETNRMLMRAWVQYMTILTRFEAPVCFELFALAEHSRLLDIGGNSGEFAHQACAVHPSLEATVMDLPGVVELGSEWNASRRDCERVSYAGMDMFSSEWPDGHDLVVFKSTLHDWDDDRSEQLLSLAWEALEPGGQLLIFERCEVDLVSRAPLAFGSLPLLMWSFMFRGPDRYLRTLAQLGCREAVLTRLELDLPWMVLAATKP